MVATVPEAQWEATLLCISSNNALLMGHLTDEAEDIYHRQGLPQLEEEVDMYEDLTVEGLMAEAHLDSTETDINRKIHGDSLSYNR